MTKENKIQITRGEYCMLYTLEDAEKIGDGDLIKGIKFIRNQLQEEGIEEIVFYKKDLGNYLIHICMTLSL